MRCYNHPETDGVAVCRACGRVICSECAIEAEDNSIGCSPACVNTLADKSQLHSRQVAHLKNLQRMNVLGSLFSIGFGLLFIYFSNLGYGIVYTLILFLGIGFTVYGVVAQLANMFIFLKNRRKSRI